MPFIASHKGVSRYGSRQASEKESGQALRERDWLVTVPRQQGGLLYLVFIAPEKDFTELRPTFERMLDSLQVQ